jgi:hypothetical protein
MDGGPEDPRPSSGVVAAHRGRARLAARASSAASARSCWTGKSMGGRIGCHLAVELAREAAASAGGEGAIVPAATVCFGYPLVARRAWHAARIRSCWRCPLPCSSCKGAATPSVRSTSSR